MVDAQNTLLARPVYPMVTSSGAAVRVLLAQLAGFAIGLSASSLFGLAVVASGKIGIGVVTPSVLGAVVAGSAFSALLAAARRQKVGWVHIFGLGLVLLVVGIAALLVPIIMESFAVNNPQPVGLFRVAFVAASTLMAGTCTAIASWMFGVPGWHRRALMVAAITGLTYLAVALALDPMPGLHVGGGNMAMPKVAAVCNVIAGFVGGTIAHLTLQHSWFST